VNIAHNLLVGEYEENNRNTQLEEPFEAEVGTRCIWNTRQML
jgi:hypothetical protein